MSVFQNGGIRQKGVSQTLNWLRAHVAFNGEGCLIWPFSRDDKGYALIVMDGKTRKACRVMCEFAHGKPSDPKHEAAHSCGRGHEGCIHPQHLSWKTRTENQRDRRLHGTAGKPGKPARSYLMPEQVAEIRALGGTMKQADIAKRYDVHPSYISKLLAGVRWKKTPVWLRAKQNGERTR